MEGGAGEQTRHTATQRQNGCQTGDVQRSGTRGRYLRVARRRQHVRRRRRRGRRYARPHRQLQETRSRLTK